MSANLIVGKDPTGNKVPVAVDASGKLQIGGVQLDNLNVNTDQIEGKQDVTNALLTTTAADVATTKGYANVTKGSGVVDSNTQRVTLASDGPGVSNLTTIASNTTPLAGVTQTSSSGKVGLDVNVISGGGGGGGGASAAYNATLPTYTSGASSTLQTDVNGRLITTGTLTDAQLRASALPVSAASLPLPSGAATSALQTTANTSLASLDADVGNVADAAATSDTGSFSLISLTKRLLGKLTDGTQTARIVNGANALAVDSAGAVTANNAASQVYNYTATGAVTSGTVLIPSGGGSIECSQIREFCLHNVSLGTGVIITPQISNDGTNWGGPTSLANNTTITNGNTSTSGFIYNISTLGARYFRIIASSAQTAGTTTLVAYASQQATPKLYQSVTGSVTVSGTVTPVVATSGFVFYHTLVSAASNNATSARGQATAMGSLTLTNSSATWAYFKAFNKTTAPTVGTDTPVMNIGVAPNSTIDCSTSYAGMRFSSGIAYCITGGAALTDNTALATGGTFLVNLTYV